MTARVPSSRLKPISEASITGAPTGETACSVGSSPYATQGWRPTSRAIQPRITATKGNGRASRISQSGKRSRMIQSRKSSGSSSQTQPRVKPIRIMKPSPTLDSTGGV